jgi:hypothetical protein
MTGIKHIYTKPSYSVNWTFHSPAVSHHSGVWERCIRTVRKVVLATLKEQQLDDESLNTLMCEFESVVNEITSH